MPLQSQVVDIPLTGGLEQKFDSLLIGKEKLLAVQNATFNADGSMTRRNAVTALSPQPTVTAGIEMMSLGNELLSVDSNNNLKGYIPNSSGHTTESRGTVPYVSLISKASISRGANQLSGIDSATSNGLTCFVWRSGVTTIQCSIIDETTGSFLINGATIETSNVLAPRVAVVGSVFLVVWGRSDVAKIRGITIPVGNDTISGSPFDIVTDYDDATPGGYDLFSLGSYALLAYSTTLANFSVGGVLIDSTGTVTASEVGLVGTGVFAHLDIFAVAIGSLTATTLGVLATSVSTTNAATLTVSAPNSATLTVTNAAASTAISSIRSSVTATNVSGVLRCFTSPVATNKHAWNTFTLNGSNVIGGSSTILFNIGNASGIEGPYLSVKAFTQGAKAYVGAVIFSALQSTLFVLDSVGNVVAKALYGTVGQSGFPGNWLFSPSTTASNVWSLPVDELGTLSFSSGTNVTQQGVSRVLFGFGRNTSFSGSTPLWHSQVADEMYFSGANPSFYDGAQVSEAGFHYFPEGVTLADSGAGGGTHPSAQYQCVAVYEWTDNKGRRHQSAPSPVVTLGAGSVTVNHGFTMTAPTLQLGVRASTSTSIVFYRTVGAGTTFYRDVASGSISGTANTLSADTVSYTSVLSDASLSANEVLYTNGGTLPNNAPSACRALTTWQNRLVIDFPEDAYQFRVSQQTTPSVGMQFNETLVYRIPQGYGPINGFGVLDDKLVIFTTFSQFWMAGTLPDSTGANSALTPIQLIPSSVGCADQRATCLIPEASLIDGKLQTFAMGGLGFKSSQGYYSLGRSLSNRYLGFPVETDLAATVNSAVVLQDRAQIRLVLDGTSNVEVFDLLMNEWTKFNYPGNTISSSCLWQGKWTLLDSVANTIYQEGTGYLDAGSTAIVVTWTTPHLRVANLQGFSRIKVIELLGAYSSNSSLSLTENVNFGAYTATTTINPTSALQPAGSSAWQMRWKPPLQKCESIQLVVTDTPDGTGNAKGLSFSALSLECGVKRGAFKLPAGQST